MPKDKTNAERVRRYRKRHLVRVKKRQHNFRRKNREYVWAYLQKHFCVDCGEDDPIVLQFDHKVKRKKKLAISEIVSRGLPRALLIREMKKCSVRCANCHQRRTAKQFGWYKKKMLASNK